MPHNTFNARQWVDDPTSGAVNDWVVYYQAAAGPATGLDIDTSDQNSIQISVVEIADVAATQMRGELQFFAGGLLPQSTPIKIHQCTSALDAMPYVITTYNFDLRLEGSTTMRIDIPAALTGGTVTVYYLFGP